MSLSSLADPVEARIVRALVDSAVGAGCSVSVWDGEAWALRSSVCQPDILDAMASSDDDVVAFRRNGSLIGSVKLIYGNGEDLISDWTLPKGTTYEGSWLEAIVVSALKVAAVRT